MKALVLIGTLLLTLPSLADIGRASCLRIEEGIYRDFIFGYRHTKISSLGGSPDRNFYLLQSLGEQQYSFEKAIPKELLIVTEKKSTTARPGPCRSALTHEVDLLKANRINLDRELIITELQIIGFSCPTNPEGQEEFDYEFAFCGGGIPTLLRPEEYKYSLSESDEKEIAELSK